MVVVQGHAPLENLENLGSLDAVLMLKFGKQQDFIVLKKVLKN